MSQYIIRTLFLGLAILAPTPLFPELTQEQKRQQDTVVVIGVSTLIAIIPILSLAFSKSETDKFGVKGLTISEKKEEERQTLFSAYEKGHSDFYIASENIRDGIKTEDFVQAANGVATELVGLAFLSNSILATKYKFIVPAKEVCPDPQIELPGNQRPTYENLLRHMEKVLYTDIAKEKGAYLAYIQRNDEIALALSNDITAKITSLGGGSVGHHAGLGVLRNYANPITRNILSNFGISLFQTGVALLTEEILKVRAQGKTDNKPVAKPLIELVDSLELFKPTVALLRTDLVSNDLEDQFRLETESGLNPWETSRRLVTVEDDIRFRLNDWPEVRLPLLFKVKEARHTLEIKAIDFAHSNLFKMSSDEMAGSAESLKDFRSKLRLLKNEGTEPADYYLSALRSNCSSFLNSVNSRVTYSRSNAAAISNSILSENFRLQKLQDELWRLSEDAFSNKSARDLRRILSGDPLSIYEKDIASEYKTELGRRRFYKTAEYQEMKSNADFTKQLLLSSEVHWGPDRVSPFELTDFDLNSGTFTLFRPKPFMDFTLFEPPSLDSVYFRGQGTKKQFLSEKGYSATLDAVSSVIRFPAPESNAFEVEKLKKSGDLEIHLFFNCIGLKQDRVRMNLQGTTFYLPFEMMEVKQAFSMLWHMFEDGEPAETLFYPEIVNIRLEIRNKKSSDLIFEYKTPGFSDIHGKNNPLSVRKSAVKANIDRQFRYIDELKGKHMQAMEEAIKDSNTLVQLEKILFLLNQSL